MRTIRPYELSELHAAGNVTEPRITARNRMRLSIRLADIIASIVVQAKRPAAAGKKLGTFATRMDRIQAQGSELGDIAHS